MGRYVPGSQRQDPDLVKNSLFRWRSLLRIPEGLLAQSVGSVLTGSRQIFDISCILCRFVMNKLFPAAGTAEKMPVP